MGLPALKIDTLEIAKELEEAGVPKAQAEAQTRVYMRVIDTFAEDTLATKKDVQTLEKKLEHQGQEIKQEIQALEKKLEHQGQEIKQEIQGLKQEITNISLKLTVRLGSIIGVGVAILAIIMKF